MRYFEFGWKTRRETFIFARGWEPQEKPKAVVCLVHGLGEHSGRYAHVAKYLNESGYAVLTFDMCGHGKSDGISGHAPSYEAMMEHISRLKGEATVHYPGTPIFLYGHSMGGNLVINYALYRKPRLQGVIATGPAFQTAFEVPFWKIAFGKALYNFFPFLPMPNEIDINGLSKDPEVVRAYLEDPLVHRRVSVRLGIDILHTGQWVMKHASQFVNPLLIMHGGKDPITSCKASREFAEKAGRCCTLKIWDDLYHEIHNEPEKLVVFQYLVNWLDLNLIGID
ncbi:MAG: alpha/beta hydrolase [Candidatus Magnetomorum sp.]|nr:alpha/beta hydrolase [Candidatus Magnetomorum sp.]